MLDSAEKLLKELTEATGVAGYEGDVRRVIRRYLEPLEEITQDKIGSLICRKVGDAAGPKVALVGPGLAGSPGAGED